jgi:predicted RecA/RadA family phage recombinase
MKRLVLLSLLLFPIFLFAQYPTFSNKQKLGVQTTGDGLIYRGDLEIPNYQPSNINNAYFYLDTVRNTLKFYKGEWIQIYPAPQFDTTTLNVYLKISDTTAMLLPYFRDSDTTQLNLINRFALKLNISDTSVMLSPYLRKADTISLSNRINNKLSLADTASMLAPYLKLADTTSMLAPYFRDSDTTMLNLNARFNSKLNATDTVSLSNRINLKLNQTDTINLSNRIDLKLNKSDTISLSNRIDIKLNPSDTVSLSNRINKKLDTIYIQYQNYLDTIVNKDTINISNTLTEGFGINIIADSINIDSAVILTTQQKQIAYVKNESGVTMYKGQAVYSSGSSGTNKLVTLASSSTEQTSSKTFGVVESESIPNGSHGYIITFGLLDKINTDNLTEGSSVYLSSTPGQLTTTKPQAPLHLVTIGVCIRRQQNNGSIFVKIQNGFELDEIHDVRITSPVNNASLYYSGGLWRDTTATLLVSDTASMLSKYVNTYSNQTNINGDKTFNNTVTIDSATVTGKLLVNTNISDAVKITSNTNSTNLELANNSGSSVYIKSSNKNMILQTDTTALVYLNGDNKKVGILTMTPQQELEVNGNARITGLNNNLVPTNLVGSSNNNDLTNVHLGEGLSFSNDTLKVDLTIIDTAIAASSITLVGDVSGSGSTNSTVNTTINNGVVTNDMLAGSISDSKLNTITTAGKISNTAFANQSANTVLAAPNGSSGTPTFRLLASADIPNLNYLPLTGGILTGGLSGTTGSFASSGGSNTFAINHSSGSGIALNITKGGNGEGLYINKTSGSGNAATIIGTLNATTLVKSGGESSQFLKADGSVDNNTYLTQSSAASTYLPLTGGTTTGLITSSFSNTNNYSTSAEDNNSFTIYNNTTSTNNIYGGLKFLIGVNSGSIPGGPGLAQIYAIRAGGVSNPSTDLTFSTKSSVSGLLEKMRIKFDGKVGIGTSTPNYLLDVNGQIGSTGFFKSGGLSTQFLKADGSVDANTYLTTGTASSTYLPLTGGTITNDLIVNDTFKSKDFGNHTFVNYIQNGDFDLTSTIDASNFNYGYPYYIPLHWKSAATSRYVSYWSSTGGYNSPGSFKQYDGDASTGGALYQDVTNWQDLKGKTVTACGWFTKGTLANTGFHAEIQINDGVTTSTTSIGTTTSWKRACVTKTISPSATRVRVIVGCNLSINSGGAVSDIDAISLVVGEGKHEFSHKPLFDRDTQRLSGTLLIGYDSENNLAYNPSATSNLKVAGSTSLNGTLGVSGVTTLSNLIGSGTRMVTASSTGLLSTQAIPTGTLGGSGTINYIPKFTAASTIGNSSIFNNAIGDVGINDDTPSYKLDVNGTFRVVNGSLFNGIMYVEDNAIFYKDVTVNRDLFMNTSQSFSGNGILTDYLKNTGIKFYDSALGNMTIFNKATSSSFGSIIFSTGNNTGNANGLPTERMRISYEGNVSINNNLSVTGQTTLTNLGGNGNRMVVTNNSGLLSTQTIPTGTVSSVSIGSPANGLTVANGTTTPVISMALAGSGTIGVVSATTQEFSGNKTFLGNVVMQNDIDNRQGYVRRGYYASSTSTYIVLDNDTWIRWSRSDLATFTLPNAADFPGRELHILNIGNGSIGSNATNIQQLDGSINNQITGAGPGKWCTLVSTGTTYWQKMAGN